MEKRALQAGVTHEPSRKGYEEQHGSDLCPDPWVVSPTLFSGTAPVPGAKDDRVQLH